MSTFQKVSPGDPWRPNAERENALTDILNRFDSGGMEQYTPRFQSADYLKVLNVSDREIPIHSPVQLDTAFVPEDSFIITRRNFCACGKPVENEYGAWGIALENIRPGESGTVQISGVALLDSPLGYYEYDYYPSATPKKRKVINNFIFPGLDGRYHFGRRGGAEVLWYGKNSGKVIVRLGAKDYQYTGMFSVLENGNGTLLVKGGLTDLPGVTSDLEDTVLPVEKGSNYHIKYILLVATVVDSYNWTVEAVSTTYPYDYYIPGQKIYWELAEYRSVIDGYIPALLQVWQGGMINFKDRYYIQ